MDLSVYEITKSFGEKQVLNGISLEARAGEALGLLGRNGAGKTTLMRIIMGIFPPDSGRVLANGQPINRRSLNIGYLPEERGLYPKKKVTEQLLYFAALHGLSKKTALKNADALFEKLDAAAYKNARLETLSKGNQQKIQLIAALITDPDIVILDEPFSGLDPVNASLFKNIVKELIQNGKTVFFSSHQMNYVEEFCDNIAILNGGKIVLGGNIKKIKRSYPRNTLLIRCENPENLSLRLKDALGGIIESADAQNDAACITLVSEKDKKRLIEAALSFESEIDEIKVMEPSLNEIFISYTEEQI